VSCNCIDGLKYLQKLDHVDIVYSDPSRRVNSQKVFFLSDCEPNIVANQDKLFDKTDIILTKVAPLLDISSALRELKQVSQVHIISVDNDCKELLFTQQKHFAGSPQLTAVRITQGKYQTFSFLQDDEKNAQSTYSAVKKYLYEPDVALSKSGAFKLIGARFSLEKLHQHSHIYTSDKLVLDFPGKIFEVQDSFPYSELKKNRHIEKANVVSKNFPVKIEDLKKKHKIKDGGALFAFFYTDITEKLAVILAKKR